MALEAELAQIKEASRSTEAACKRLARECAELETRARRDAAKAAEAAAALDEEVVLREVCEGQLKQLQHYVSSSLLAPPTSLLAAPTSLSPAAKSPPSALQRPLPSPVSFGCVGDASNSHRSFVDSPVELLAEVRAAAARAHR